MRTLREKCHGQSEMAFRPVCTTVVAFSSLLSFRLCFSMQFDLLLKRNVVHVGIEKCAINVCYCRSLENTLSGVTCKHASQTCSCRSPHNYFKSLDIYKYTNPKVLGLGFVLATSSVLGRSIQWLGNCSPGQAL